MNASCFVEREEFGVRAIGDAERVVRGFQDHRGRIADLVMRDSEREWGKISFWPDHVEALRNACAIALGGGTTSSVECSGLPGREISIRLIARPKYALLVLERVRTADDTLVGRSITLNSDEIASIQKALDWLSEAP